MTRLKDSWRGMPKWLQIVIYSILGISFVAAIGALFGFVIMWLWNWLMPLLFGLREISYWPAVGIFVLAKILFGSVGSSNGAATKPKDKKEDRSSQRGGERKTEPDGVEYYDEWWEKQGKAAFSDFVSNRYTSGKASEIESERGTKG